jgi:hypothetical protein
VLSKIIFDLLKREKNGEWDTSQVMLMRFIRKIWDGKVFDPETSIVNIKATLLHQFS